MQRSFFIGSKLGLRREFFFENPKLLGLGRQIGLKILGGILGIFGQFISTHFGTDSLLSMFSINQPLFLKKKLSFFIQISNIYLGLGFEFEFGLQKIRDLSFVCP